MKPHQPLVLQVFLYYCAEIISKGSSCFLAAPLIKITAQDQT